METGHFWAAEREGEEREGEEREGAEREAIDESDGS
jgi:hypothetical protein